MKYRIFYRVSNKNLYNIKEKRKKLRDFYTERRIKRER
jgi:hypothetical protein